MNSFSVEQHRRKTLVDELRWYRSFEEFMLMKEMSGSPVSEVDIGKIAASLIGIAVLRSHAIGDEGLPDEFYLDYIDSIVCDKDLITSKNNTSVIENICLAICSEMGTTKSRARLMKVFKHLSKKFPKEMTDTYTRHKVMAKYGA